MKNEMVNLELLEFHYFDDILTDMKLTPGLYQIKIYCRLWLQSYFMSLKSPW